MRGEPCPPARRTARTAPAPSATRAGPFLMADTAPRLPETPTADRTTYAPYAVLAVAAVAVAGLFVVILIGLALAAFATKQKIFAPSLLAGPAFALVLAFAG